MKIAKHLTDLIGHTPLLELAGYAHKHKSNATLIAKLEYFNPASSIKDRVAFAMIADAENKGLLKPGGEIIEPTSGNTGIGLAFVAASKGYRLTLTMPESMSLERRNLLKALGANIVLTPAAEGMGGSIRKAEELKRENPAAVILQQFENPANPLAHEQTTAQEIWEDMDGKVDMVVACVGTGGTVSGIGRGLKKHNPNIRMVAVEPATSAVLSGKPAGKHGIQGIGAGFVPKIYDATVVDEIVCVADTDAMETSRELAHTEGLLVGISAGAAVWAATQIARRQENQGKNIVIILPDTGERYLSTGIYD